MKSNGLVPVGAIAAPVSPIMPPLPPGKVPVRNPLQLTPRYGRIMASVALSRRPAE